MKNFKTSIMLTTLLFTPTILLANENYNCVVYKYVNKTQATHQEVGDRIVPSDGNVQSLITGAGEEELSWKFSRKKNKLIVEIEDNNQQPISISSVRDGEPLGIELKKTKNILTCTPPNDAFKFVIDPQTNGATIQIHDSFIVPKTKKAYSDFYNALVIGVEELPTIEEWFDMNPELIKEIDQFTQETLPDSLLNEDE